MRVSIIGTAGRKEDGPKMSSMLYTRMFELALEQNHMANPEQITLVSGGAAWADHIAVSMYLVLRDRPAGGPRLELYLPAPQFVNARFEGNEDARTANFYHKLFSDNLGKPGQSLRTLENIKNNKDVVFHYGDGFKARNLEVGKSDVIHAFTFGVRSYEGGYCSSKEAGLKDGGTAHTWNNANQKAHFIHTNLTDLI